MGISLLNHDDIVIGLAQTEVVSRCFRWRSFAGMIPGSVWTGPVQAGLSGNNSSARRRLSTFRRDIGRWMCKRTSVIVIRVNVNNAVTSTRSADNTRVDERSAEKSTRCARERSAWRSSEGEPLVIRSIVQANDAMIHQHKLIWPLQLCHAAVLYRENDRVHGASTARPSINSRRLFPGPHRGRPFFGY